MCYDHIVLTDFVGTMCYVNEKNAHLAVFL